jgi:hypothetical protein
MALGVAMAIKGHHLFTIINDMTHVAAALSILNAPEEEEEWRATPASYKPAGKRALDEPPYTVAQRITDAHAAEADGISPDTFYENNKGWGAPDFIAALVFTALRARRKGWSVSQAMNRVVNTTAGTDRDSIASGVGQFLGAHDGPPSGIDKKEFMVLERFESRKELAYKAAAQLSA